MTISALEATRFIGKQTGWSKSNLELQKILYITHMFYLGQSGNPLINESFEAWDYGPVQPQTYHKCKIFGASSVEDIFFSTANINEETEEAKTLKDTVPVLAKIPSWELVSITHWEKGAWIKNYEPGRNTNIPTEDIKEEYERRISAIKERKNSQ